MLVNLALLFYQATSETMSIPFAFMLTEEGDNKELGVLYQKVKRVMKEIHQNAKSVDALFNIADDW